MKTIKGIIILVFIVFSFVALEAGQKPNCKLTIRTYFKEGGKALKIEDIQVASRKDCKKEAKTRRIIEDPEDISKIKVSFSFRKPNPWY